MRHLLVLAAIWNGNPWEIDEYGNVVTIWPQDTAVVPAHLYWAIDAAEVNQRVALQLAVGRTEWDRGRRAIGLG